MGIPAEMTAHSLNAVVTPTAPAPGILTRPLQGLLKGTGIGHINQQTVVATG